MDKAEMIQHIAYAQGPHGKDLQDGKMVYQVWEDGEITLQKAGALLWSRNLHCIVPGCSTPWPLDVFPEQYNNHAFVFAKDHEHAMQLARLIGNKLA